MKNNRLDLYKKILYLCFLESMHSKNAKYYKEFCNINLSESDISNVDKLDMIRYIIIVIGIIIGCLSYTVEIIAVSFGLACIVSFVPYLILAYILYSKLFKRGKMQHEKDN